MSTSIALVHMQADMEKMRARAFNVLSDELDQLRTVAIALTRTPPKVEISAEVLSQICERLQKLRDELASAK